jgi:hypothetical protein
MQSTHDRRVRQEAERLRRNGWNVRADLPGYRKPYPIGQGGVTPDVEAVKSGRRKLIEVETPNSVKADKDQHSTLCRSAAQKSNTTFKIVVTDN